MFIFYCKKKSAQKYIPFQTRIKAAANLFLHAKHSFRQKDAAHISLTGFTLVELLVVISIIGVLASLLLASLVGVRQRSRDTRRVTDIKQLQLALELYFDGLGAGSYPLGLVADGPPCANNSGLTPLATNGYISSIPHDPGNPGTCYRYRSQAPSSGIRTFYHLAALLEDGNNNALFVDKDCNDATAGSCSLGSTGWVGSTINGNSSDCAAGAVPDRCFDVTP